MCRMYDAKQVLNVIIVSYLIGSNAPLIKKEVLKGTKHIPGPLRFGACVLFNVWLTLPPCLWRHIQLPASRKKVMPSVHEEVIRQIYAEIVLIWKWSHFSISQPRAFYSCQSFFVFQFCLFHLYPYYLFLIYFYCDVFKNHCKNPPCV